jgi:hypothetical protein
MAGNLTDAEWTALVKNIMDGRCTPFLGAGACYPDLPLGSQLAQELAKEHRYPLSDGNDLVKVAQYLAVMNYPLYPHERVLELLRQKEASLKDPRHRDWEAAPAFNPGAPNADEPHGIMAQMRALPLYMTTNYDGFMSGALQRSNRDPQREMCRWNHYVADEPSIFDANPGLVPHPANPVVFHLHGHTRPESLVVTEDDYLRFLGEMVRRPDLLPRAVARQLGLNTLLFIGYRVNDWNFRVLLRALRPDELRQSYVVLKQPDGDDEIRRKAQDYLTKYYEAMELRVYWGTARDFCKELWQRYQDQLKSAN